MDEVHQRFVAHLLERHGFTVEPIPEAKEKRADYWATVGDERYLIEVKAKCDDEAYRRDLDTKGQATIERKIMRSNTMQAIIEDAVRQLQATPADAEAFRVMTFVAAGSHPEAQLDEMKSTLWGLADLIDLDEIEAGKAVKDRPCYYFDRAVFRQATKLDAVLAIWPHKGGKWVAGGRLHPNPWSERAGAFRTSTLWRQMASQDAVTDPLAEEREGAALVADCDSIPLGEEGRRLGYVQEKYGRPCLTRLTPHHFVAAITVRPSDL